MTDHHPLTSCWPHWWDAEEPKSPGQRAVVSAVWWGVTFSVKPADDLRLPSSVSVDAMTRDEAEPTTTG